MSLKNETAVSTTVEHEELDYEEDDVDRSVKNSPVILERQGDLEEGEILDEDSEDYPNKKICEFFKCGRCQLGDHCRYLHVTDKGLYRMLEEEVKSPTSSFAPPQFPLPLFPSQLNSEQPIFNASELHNCDQPETSPTAWDRALKEAKKFIKKWDTAVKRTSNPIVITIDTDDEPPSNKSPKKPRYYKSPEPKVIPRKPAHFGRSPERNIVQDKNDKHLWHDPWRRSPVRRTKPPLRSSKIRRKKSTASSSSSECSSKWFRHRKQNCPSISERRRRETVEKRHRKILRRSSSSSFSPESVYRPVDHKKETKLQSTEENKNKYPSAANTRGKNLKLNDAVRKYIPPIIPIYDENRHKGVLPRSSSRSPGPASTRTSAKEDKKIYIVENKFDRNLKNDPIKRDSLSMKTADAENWHKAVLRRSSSRSPGPISIHQSRRTSAKERSMSAREVRKTSPTVERKSDRNFKNDPIKKGLPSLPPDNAESWYKVIPRRSYSRSPGPTSMYLPGRTSVKERSRSARKDREKSSTLENKLDGKFKNDLVKRDLPSSTLAHAENWHKAIPRRSSSRSPVLASMYQSRRVAAKEDRENSPAFENKYDSHFKNRSVKKNSHSNSPAHAENWHKVISRRSSTSPCPASMYHSRTSAKEEKKMSPDIKNKFDKNFKSSSCSPASVYRSRNEKSKSVTKLQSTNQSIENKTAKIFKGKGIELPTSSSSFTSALHSNDVCQWTPRKMRPLSPRVDSCSDMSISPLSDHYLSDLFDPDKKASKLGGTHQREMIRPRTFLPSKRQSTEVYGPICPPVQNTSEAPKCATENKAVDHSKPKKVKKRNTSALEADLLKFQHRSRIAVPQSSSKKSDVQRETETKSDKTSKSNISQTQEMKETKRSEIPKEAPLVQRKQISKKEMLLKQLEEINAAIEKRKQMSDIQRQ